jgi:dipeptidyl aminopeptidase/acylaminoacyl peptidase
VFLGVQLAALPGMEDTPGDSSKVQAVVDVSGPTDFTTGSDERPPGRGFRSLFLGADYAQHGEVWRAASPGFHAASEDAPFLIVHGTRDQNVPIAQAQELFEKLQGAGVPVSFIKVDDVHTFATPEAVRRLVMETLAFFRKYLGAAEPGDLRPASQ